MDLAIAALDLLCTDTIRKRDERIAIVAENAKAVILHQAGRTDEALDLVIPSYHPDKKVSDYYHRSSLDWVYQELIPAAPDRFLEVLDKEITKGKRTVAQTDQRLAVIQRSEDENRVREGYEQAIKDHPDQIKYVQQYERWEQDAGRIAAAIAINEHQLALLSDDEPGKAKAKTIQRRLAALWFSVNHRVNGLPLWSIDDEQDRVQFESEVKAREKTQLDAKSIEGATDEAKKKDEAAKSKPAESDDTKKPAQKVYANTIAGVKTAIQDKDFVAAGNVLRELWREFPQVVESPYSYRSSRRRINGLLWPADPLNKEVTEPTAAERCAADETRREKLRGGLATLTPPPPRPAVQKADSAWKVLAAEPFAVAEMRRLLRSRSPEEMANVSDVVLGLLQADRLDRGDEAVFAALVDKLANGQSSTVELTQFFTMLEEDPGRIDSEHRSVIDGLLQQLDLNQLNMASRLAKVCASIGQLDRAAALYTHSALLAPAQGVTFSSLIEQASEVFKDDSLIELAERMFAVATHDTVTINRMLDLRMELLPPEVVAKRSAELFDKLQDDPDTYPITQAIRGAQMFAEVGEFDRAWKCLTIALRQHGKPRQQSASYYYYENAANVAVSRSDLLRVFPQEASRFSDYPAWLSKAAAANAEWVAHDSVQSDLAVQMQSIIALRQCQQNQQAAAVETLQFITKDLLSREKTDLLLVIDVMREAKLIHRALEIESWLYQRGQLSHLRFGDLLHDTSEVEGDASAMRLADELLGKSLDEDLIFAAIEIASHDPFHADRISAIVQQRQSAEREFAERTEAAGERRKTRAAWKQAVKP